MDTPLEDIAQDLRDRTAAASGWEGALLGAALGVVSALNAAHKGAGAVTPQALLAGAVVGGAYGAAEKRQLGRP